MRKNKSNQGNMNKIKQLLSLAFCFLMILAVSIRRDSKWLGHSIESSRQAATAVNDTLRTESDGTIVVNTTQLGKDITGFGGTVPLRIFIRDGKITKVEAMKNSETPDFFKKAQSLLTFWNGKSLDEAAATQPDAVSGATYSSKAIIGNMQRGIQFAQRATAETHWYDSLDLSAKALAGLVVALMAAVVPLFYRNRRYRIIQQILNVAVLGFWCGTFVSYTSLISFMSNGMNVVSLLVPTVLLITAFLYPLFGKKQYYCTNICPFGSLQELVGRGISYKIRLSPVLVRRLRTFRRVLWAVLMLCLWTGAWFDWIDYEPFSAFIVQSASWVAIAVAVAFTALSAVVMRPYCRFVCPTGTLLKISETNKLKW